MTARREGPPPEPNKTWEEFEWHAAVHRETHRANMEANRWRSIVNHPGIRQKNPTPWRLFCHSVKKLVRIEWWT